MKFKLILLTIFLSCAHFLQAQLTITTNLAEEGIFDEKNIQWDISKTTSGLSVFTFNNELTSFRHTNGAKSINYKIDDWTYDNDEVLYEMIITSETGDEYDFLIDGINEYAIFFYYDKNGKYNMVRYTIQDTYFDE